jgi:ankyrin repeat protein
MNGILVAIANEMVDVLEQQITSAELANSISPHSGRSLLHIAADNLVPLAVAKLIEKGADINSQDEAGLTPIMLAVDIEVASVTDGYPLSYLGRCSRILFEARADLALKNHAGESLWDIARGFRSEYETLFDQRK